MTKKTQRTDCHRPGAIVPADYTAPICYIAYPNGPFDPAWNVDCVLKFQTGRETFGGLGKCGVCGANFRFGAVYLHTPTGTAVHMGEDCARKYECAADDPDFDAHREMVARRHKTERIRKAFCDKYPGLAEALEKGTHKIIADLSAKLDQYHSLSDKQVALALRLYDQQLHPLPPPPAEKHVRCPEGRQTFQGVVLSKRLYATDFGNTFKVTIKVATPDGSWLAWGTLPAALLSLDPVVSVGDTVEMTATLTPGGREPHFCFMKRPLGRVVARKAATSA